MPRDGNGNFTLVSGNPVVPGTLIEASWANSTMEDMAIALTNSLSRNGNGGMLAPLGFIDGSVNAPGMFFNSQVNMGLHRAALNDMRIVMDGGTVAQFSPAIVNMQVPDLQVQGVSVLTTDDLVNIDLESLTVSGDQVTGIDIDRPSNAAAGLVVRNNEGGVRLQTDSGGFIIYQTNAAGTAQDEWITGAANGAVGLRFNDSEKLATTNTGVSVSGNLAVSGTLNAGNTTVGTITTGTIQAGGSTVNCGTINAGAINGSQLRTTGNTEIQIRGERPNGNPAQIQVGNSEGGAGLRVDAGGLQIRQLSPTGGAEDIWFDADDNGATRMRFNNSTKLATKSNGITVTGEVAASANVRAGVSDLRLKNVQAWINPAKCLNTVLDYGVIRYLDKDLWDGAQIDTPQIGLIAQQVGSDWPELTYPAPMDLGENGESISGENYLSLDYQRMTAVLVGAVQRLHMELQDAKNDIARIRRNNA